MAITEIFSGFTFWSLMLFVSGLLLLAIEIFIPGFRVIGAAGVLLLVLFVVVSAKSLTHGLILGGILLLLLFVLFLIFLWAGSKGRLPKKAVLFNEQSKSEGYTTADFESFLGTSGFAASSLRPAGIMRAANRNLDVVSEGEFIEKGAALKVVKVEGNRLVVERDL